MKRLNCHCNSAAVIPTDCNQSWMSTFRNVLLSEFGSEYDCLDEIDSFDSGNKPLYHSYQILIVPFIWKEEGQTLFFLWAKIAPHYQVNVFSIN